MLAIKIAAFVLILAASVGCGVWLAARPGGFAPRIPREPRLQRTQLRSELTPGERRFLLGYGLVSPLVAPAGVLLLVFGGSSTRAVGIALLVAALVVMAVPVSPFLRARVRQREKGDSK
jgi:hypothetical protein